MTGRIDRMGRLLEGGVNAVGTGGWFNCNRSGGGFPSNRKLCWQEFRRVYPPDAIRPDREPLPGPCRIEYISRTAR